MYAKPRIAVLVLFIFFCSLATVFADPLEDSADYTALGVPGQN